VEDGAAGLLKGAYQILHTLPTGLINTLLQRGVQPGPAFSTALAVFAHGQTAEAVLMFSPFSTPR